MKAGDSITVRVLKYDGSEYRRWNATVASDDESLLVLDAEFDVEVQHPDLGHIPRGTRTIEYYWREKWYNVFRFLDDRGATRLWYCNINLPPAIEDGSITYVDLDIDVVLQSDFSYQILDLGEFEHHAQLFSYPRKIKDSAQQALTELLARIENRQFPFHQ